MQIVVTKNQVNQIFLKGASLIERSQIGCDMTLRAMAYGNGLTSFKDDGQMIYSPISNASATKT
jgi:hypothetical protein